MAKKSFSKNLLRLGSMILTVLLLVSTMFTGAVAAEGVVHAGNVIKVANNARAVDFGQHVVLDIGKTYAFSFYINGPLSPWNCICDANNKTFGLDKTEFDGEYKKETRYFTVPADAAPAEETGKAKVFVGLQIPSANYYYIYSPCLYAVDDATKTNLFFDYEFTGKYTLADADGGPGNWSRFNGVLGYRFTKPNLESLGGFDSLFKRTDSEKYVIKLATGVAVGDSTFGQKVALKEGETYSFSSYFAGPEILHLIRRFGGSDIEPVITNLDYDYNKKTTTFTVPSDAPDAGNGNRFVYVGLYGPSRSAESYHYGLKLYNIKNPDENLLQDSGLIAGDDAISGTNNGGVWRRASKEGIEATAYSKVTLEAAGGMSIFTKTDAQKYVVKMVANQSTKYSATNFGQAVSLEEGKQYAFSFCYTGPTANHLIRFLDDPLTYTDVPIDDVIIDNDVLRKTSVFTVPSNAPDDGNGKKLIYVGLYGQTVSTETYYYDFKICEVDKPGINLLKDTILDTNGSNIDNTIWRRGSASGLASGVFSKTTMADIGGKSVFVRTAEATNVLKLIPNATSSYAALGQKVALKEGKTYIFSCYYTGPETTHLIRRFGTYNDVEADTVVVDKDISKKTVTFTVPSDAPDDGNGNKLLWVGILGRKVAFETCYYGFELRDAQNPEFNIFKDSGLVNNGGSIDSVWTRPSGTLYPGYFTKVTMADAGGKGIFVPYEKKFDVNGDTAVDLLDLVGLKKACAGVGALPEGIGDVNCNGNLSADDISILINTLLG